MSFEHLLVVQWCPAPKDLKAAEEKEVNGALLLYLRRGRMFSETSGQCLSSCSGRCGHFYNLFSRSGRQIL